MNKIILIEYADMKEEIKDLQRRIEEDRQAINKLNCMTVADTVSCGKKGKKTLGTVRIEGRPLAAIERKKSAYKRKMEILEEIEVDLLEKQTEVEEYIQQISRSELRMIFRLYYVDDLSWVQVAHRMNMMYSKKRAYTDDSCRCKHNRFLEKNEETTVATDSK